MQIRPRIVRGKAKYHDARWSLRHFQSEHNFGRGSERIPITYAIVTGASKVKPKSLGAVAHSQINTWLPRSNFICSNNYTLLTAGYCKSELRYLRH